MGKKVFILIGIITILYSFNEGSENSFFKKPFGFEPTIENFKNYDQLKFKTQKYVLKKFPTDTIYKFIYKKSYILINKSFNKEIFIGGIIKDKQFPLNNDVWIGMEKEEFKKTFHNELKQENDTLILRNKDYKNSYYFIYKNNKLNTIQINNK